TEDFKNYTDVLGFSDSQDERGTELLHDFWYVFSSLIPQENREILTEVSWYDTGEDYVLAVGISEENVDERLLIVSHNLVHYVSDIKRLFLHEYAHMFTLADDQILLDEELANSEDEDQWKIAEEECKTLFSIWGCLREDSYMYSFYNEFWKDIDEDYQAIDWDDGEGYERFFFRHEDHFYNSYQGTSIEEDIAETFTFFIMQSSEVALQAEEIKDEKIAFFYEYDELIHLRTEILENLFELNVDCIIKRDKKRTCYDTLKLTYHC